MKTLFFICVWFLGACTQQNTEPVITPSSVKFFTEEDHRLIHLLTTNAFFEASIEGHTNIAVQIHSVLNRARRWHKNDIQATIEKPWAYSWKKTIPAKRQAAMIERGYPKFKEIMALVVDIYAQHKKGARMSIIITNDTDHYLTKKLANSGNAPHWFYKHCADKRTVGRHIYCIGEKR